MGTGHILAIELAGYLESKKMIISIDYNASLLAKDKISYKKALQKIGLSRIDAVIKDDYIYILECNSIIVTGVHRNQIDYGIYFLQKEGANLAEMLVNNALVIFEQKNMKQSHYV